MRYLDFFAGIGGFHLGFDRVGWDFVGFCEWDEDARTSYKAIHDTEGATEWHDITKISNDDFRLYRGHIDIIAGGFPCQAFSINGQQGGFEDTRGTLFFEIARAAKEIKPRFLLLENVKNLIHHKGGYTFRTILNTLYELGYAHIEWGVFDSKKWGVPQFRERVYIIAERREQPTKPYLLPLMQIQENAKDADNLMDLIDWETFDNYTAPVDKFEGLISIDGDKATVREATKLGYAVAYDGDGINFSHPKSTTRRGRVGRKSVKTILTRNEHVVFTGGKLKYLSPLEYWRLQAFEDEHFFKAKAQGISETQLYKQAGNSVTVNVVEAIAREIQRRVDEENEM